MGKIWSGQKKTHCLINQFLDCDTTQTTRTEKAAARGPGRQKISPGGDGRPLDGDLVGERRLGLPVGGGFGLCAGWPAGWVRWGRGVRKQREVSEGLSREGVLEVSGRRGLAPGWIGARVDHLAGDSDKIFCFVGGLGLYAGTWYLCFFVSLLLFEASVFFSLLFEASAYFRHLIYVQKCAVYPRNILIHKASHIYFLLCCNSYVVIDLSSISKISIHNVLVPK
jgi:hypothetical protein